MTWNDSTGWNDVANPTFEDVTVQGDLTVQGSTKTKTDETLQGDTTIGDEDSDNLDINATLNTEFKLGNNQLTNANRVTFNSITDPAHSEGQLWYSSDTQTFSAHIDRSSVTLNIGEENWIRVFNNTGSTISNGDVVYISGFDSNSGHPQAALAKADSFSTSNVAGVATEDIADGGSGIITTAGYVRNVDTSAFTAGETLWLSDSTAGGLSTTEPSSPNFSIRVGQVGRSDASSGQLLVSLGERRASLYQQGSVLFADSNGRLIEDNSNLSWDSGTNTFDAANITESGTSVVTETRSLTGGTGIESIGDLSSDRTVAVDTTATLSWDNNQTFNGGATLGGELSMNDGQNISAGTTTGTQVGTSASQMLGFFGTSPVAQQTAPTSLTNNMTATTTDDSLEGVGDTSAGDESAPIERNFTELKDEVDQIRTVLTNLGLAA